MNIKQFEGSMKFLYMIFFAVNLVIISYFIFISYKFYLHSDAAYGLILANEILNSRSYFPPDWNYTLEVWIDRHLLFIPGLLIFSFGYKAFAFGIFLYALVLFVGTWLAFGEIFQDQARKYTILAISAAGISILNFQNIFGEHSYGLFLAYSLFLIYLTLRWFSEKSQNKHLLFISLILTLTFCSNPSRAALNYCAPLVITVSLSANLISRSKLIKYFYTVILSAILGSILNKLLISSVLFSTAYADLTWKSFNIISAISIGSDSFFSLLGVFNSNGIKIMSGQGIYVGLRLACCLGIFFLAIYVSLKNKQAKSFNIRFFIIFSWVSFLLMLLMEASSTLNGHRYLNPAILMLASLAVGYPLYIKTNPKLFICQFLCFLALSSSSIYLLLLPKTIHADLADVSSHDQVQLVEFLLKHDLTDGYGTWWNSHSITTLSNGKVKIRPAHIDQDTPLPTPIKAGSLNSWYKPKNIEGKTFLLLRKQEAKLLNIEALNSLGLIPIETLHFSDYEIITFRGDIANKLPWNSDFPSPISYSPSRITPTEVGTLEPDLKSKKLRLVSNKGTAGALQFGPYWDISPGKYLLKFDLKSSATENKTAYRIDAYCSQESITLGEISSNPNKPNNELIFAVQKPCKVEFRVWSHGTESLVLNHTRISRLY